MRSFLGKSCSSWLLSSVSVSVLKKGSSISVVCVYVCVCVRACVQLPVKSFDKLRHFNPCFSWGLLSNGIFRWIIFYFLTKSLHKIPGLNFEELVDEAEICIPTKIAFASVELKFCFYVNSIISLNCHFLNDPERSGRNFEDVVKLQTLCYADTESNVITLGYERLWSKGLGFATGMF